VLMQHGQPVAYLSKALGESHKHMSIYEKEFLALIMAVERWRQYLQRGEFVIKTDDKSLAYLTEQNLHSDMQRKAMTRLMGLQFKVVYKKGKDNQAADALSRVGHLLALQAISQVQPQWVQEVINSYVTDSRAQELLSQLAVHTPNDQGYSLHQSLIRYQGRLWVGANSAIQTKIIAAFHSSAVGDILGSMQLITELRDSFVGNASNKMWQHLFLSATSANKQSICILILRDFSNHYPFQRAHGKISHWTS